MITTLSEKLQPRSIGEYQERSLHAALKAWYSQPGDEIEALVDRYRIDIKRGPLLIEIQTRNFSALRRKLTQLLIHSKVRVIYPLALQKQIIVCDPQTGELIRNRKSPKRALLTDMFSELLRIPKQAVHPNFSLEVVCISETEVRIPDGTGSWRRKGLRVADRQLSAIISYHMFETPADYLAMLPFSDTGIYTTRFVATALGISAWRARHMLYTLREMGLISASGKIGNLITYTKL